jgi:multidrug efflux pump subunit AcrB
MGILSRLSESLRIRLANLPGTEISESWGATDEEVLVSLDAHRLADAGVTPTQVAEAIRRADTKLPSGRLRSARTEMLVEVDAELASTERIGRVPIVMNAGQQVLRVADLGTVSRHWLDPPNSSAFHGTRRVVLVNAKMQPGLNIDRWTSAAMAAVDGFRDTLPSQVGVQVVYNQNTYTAERMRSLGQNLAFALVIVTVSLIWFMGLRSALTVAIALPLSAGMVLTGMQFMDIPLHQMSVTGLIISLGLLIDNAIVVVEDYKLRRARGEPIGDAITSAVRHLLVPLGASTATTVFAFMPIALAPGGVGDFTGTIGVSVALAVASSFLIAMSIVPAIAGMLERRWPSSAGHRWWQSGFRSEALTGAYRRTIEATLRRPWIGLAIGCTLPIIGFALAPTLTQQFFPPVDRNQFQVQINLPPHASMDETVAAIGRAEHVLRAHADVTDTFWTTGKGAPQVFYNVNSLNERVLSYASGWVNTTSAQATRRLLPELQQALSRALPEAEVLAIPFEQGPPTDAPIEVRIIGPELSVLREQAQELRRILSTVPGVTYTRATLSTAEPKLSFVPNESAAAAAGLSTGELSRRLNSALLGELAGTLQEGNMELPVRVRLTDGQRDDVADLADLPLSTASGRGVPLSQLGEWRLLPTASAIDRYQGARVSTVHGYLVPFTLPAGVLSDFQDEMARAGFELPPGYALSIGGEAEESAESMGNILSIFLFFALAMAAVVILSLNSFREALLIGAVALLSFGLALFGVRLFGYPFGYMALIGALGMMGLAINGAIIVLSALKADHGARQADTAATADVVVNATRHIASTTATTIGGFVPLIIDGGTFWPPLATAIAGGVGGSALIALYMVPALYHWLRRRQAANASAARHTSPVQALPVQHLQQQAR